MDEQRQAKLDAVLEDLRKVPGLSVVESDDYDSTSIWVFCQLQRLRPDHRGKVFKWAVPLRTVKAGIRHVFKKHDYNFDFLDWPVMKYYDMGGGLGKAKDGYDGSSIKLNVWIYETPKPARPRDPQLTF